MCTILGLAGIWVFPDYKSCIANAVLPCSYEWPTWSTQFTNLTFEDEWCAAIYFYDNLGIRPIEMKIRLRLKWCRYYLLLNLVNAECVTLYFSSLWMN